VAPSSQHQRWINKKIRKLTMVRFRGTSAPLARSFDLISDLTAPCRILWLLCFQRFLASNRAFVVFLYASSKLVAERKCPFHQHNQHMDDAKKKTFELMENHRYNKMLYCCGNLKCMQQSYTHLDRNNSVCAVPFDTWVGPRQLTNTWLYPMRGRSVALSSWYTLTFSVDGYTVIHSTDRMIR
jgi:hypothetical protein